jgi:pimeloyl-ACP methyl ester carboxylesterase
MECQLGDLSIHYKTIGTGKPFVTISGIPSDHRIIESWLEPIFQNRPGWQRFYFDLPGTGQTSGAGITHMDQILDVVCGFIDTVIPQQHFTLLGLSAGGYLARGAAHRKANLVDGLCLLVPWLSEHDDQVLPAPVTFFRDEDVLSQLSPEDADRLAGLAVVQNQKVVDWYRDIIIPARPRENKSLLEQRTYSFDLDTIAKPFEKPTLILTGRQDTHVGYRDGWNILEKYPRASFVVLDRAGHALGVEQAVLLHALIYEWLDRVEETRSHP